MMSKIKRMLVIVPCMLFALFVFAGVKVCATEATVTNGSKIVVGSASKENTYYFSNSKTWEFEVENYNAWNPFDMDTLLKYRVISPDGKISSWSAKVYYVDTQGIFTIADYTALDYHTPVGEEIAAVSSKSSVAPLSTYYVEIEYYAQVIWESHQKDKDETIKVVADNILYANEMKPTITINYNEGTNKYAINVSNMLQNKGLSIITNIDYFFSTAADQAGSESAFYTNMKSSSNKGTLSFAYSPSVDVDLNGVDASYTKLYVLAKNGNGYSTIKEFNIPSKSESSTTTVDPNKPVTDNTTTEKSSGLFDYKFGELILIVLIIVLFVSCALIITQKIVDYKKRLY